MTSRLMILAAFLAALAGLDAGSRVAQLDYRPKPDITNAVPSLVEVARRAPLAFRGDATGFAAAGHGHTARVGENGALAVSARLGPPVSCTFDTEAIRAGNEEVALHTGASRLDHEGDVVSEHGSIEERVRNEGVGVEQSWRFEGRPAGDGSLAVRVRVTGCAFASASSDGLRFAGESGAMLRYGVATWIDGSGVRTPVATRYEGGGISISVPRDVVKDSTFPAVLDPTV